MRKLLLILLLAMAAPAAFANHYADFYVLPVASHVTGAAGTFWMSDVAVQNFQSTSITVNVFLIESGEANTENVTALSSTLVPAGGSVLLKDMLAGQSKPELSGAIMVGAELPFAVTSRTYVTTPGGGTYGQTVQPARDFIENSLGDTNPAMATAYLPGLIANTRFRTNIGFVAGTSNTAVSPMEVQVTLKTAAGATLGSPKTYIIPANSFRHLQFSTRSIADSSFDIGSAELRILSGDGAVAPYASVVDNITADAVYVVGQFPPNTPLAKLGMRSVFRRLFDSLVSK